MVIFEADGERPFQLILLPFLQPQHALHKVIILPAVVKASEESDIALQILVIRFWVPITLGGLGSVADSGDFSSLQWG